MMTVKERFVGRWLPWAIAIAVLGLATLFYSPAKATFSGCPIRIGFVRAYSGKGAVYGQSLDRGVQMGFDEINAAGGVCGCKVQLVTYDSQSVPANTSALVRRLTMRDNVSLIIASSPSTEIFAAEEVAETMGIPLYAPSAPSARITGQGYSWIWCQSLVDTAAATALADYIVQKQGWRRIGIVYENSDYAKPTVQNALAPRLRQLGAEIVAQEAFNTGDADLSAQLLRIRDAGADALLYWGHEKEAAILTKENQSEQVRLPIAANTAVVYPAYLSLLPGDIQDETKLYAIGQFLWTSRAPKDAKWIQAFEDRYHTIPDVTAREGYDAAYLLKQVFSAAHDFSPKSLQSSLNTVHFDGIGGPISFDSTGRARRSQMIVKLTPKSGLGFQLVERIPADQTNISQP
jgi:branched-chain amino acid transport system substrate-binding protein